MLHLFPKQSIYLGFVEFHSLQILGWPVDYADIEDEKQSRLWRDLLWLVFDKQKKG